MWHPSTFATTGNLMFHLVPSFCWCKQVTNAPTFHCAIEHVIRKASLPTVLLFQRIFRPGSGSPPEKKAGGSWVTWQSKWSFSGFWGETNLGKLNVAWRSKHFVLVEPTRGQTTTVMGKPCTSKSDQHLLRRTCWWTNCFPCLKQNKMAVKQNSSKIHCNHFSTQNCGHFWTVHYKYQLRVPEGSQRGPSLLQDRIHLKGKGDLRQICASQIGCFSMDLPTFASAHWSSFRMIWKLLHQFKFRSWLVREAEVIVI